MRKFVCGVVTVNINMAKRNVDDSKHKHGEEETTVNINMAKRDVDNRLRDSHPHSV